MHNALKIVLRYYLTPHKLTERLLGFYYPNTSALQSEIQAIETKLVSTPDIHAQQRLSTRLIHLKTRLTQPPELTRTRLQQLDKKLHRAALQDLFQRWLQECNQSVKHHLQKKFYLKHPIPTAWLNNPTYFDLLNALGRFSESERQLAGLLLQAELQGNYCLLDEPANQEWLSTMQRKGLNLTAWLEPLSLTPTIDPKHPPLTFRWAHSLFEVLQMGSYFRTCLSMNHCNFYSTLSNAADINKRVLYACDAKGVIQGRCLLAITDQGYLVSFKPYSHLPAQIFQKALLPVIEYLEQQLNTRYCAGGKISTLVSQRWYDDGLVLLHNHEGLKRFMTFRKQLKTLAPETIVNAYLHAISPQPLNEMAIENLLLLPELTEQYSVWLIIISQAHAQGLLTLTTRQQWVLTLAELLNKEHYPLLWTVAQDWLSTYIHNEVINGAQQLPAITSLLCTQYPAGAVELLDSLSTHIAQFNEVDQYAAGLQHIQALIDCHRLSEAQTVLQQVQKLNYAQVPAALVAACEVPNNYSANTPT